MKYFATVYNKLTGEIVTSHYALAWTGPSTHTFKIQDYIDILNQSTSMRQYVLEEGSEKPHQSEFTFQLVENKANII